MTNREKIVQLIKTNFPDIEVCWEQNGDMVKRDKNGVEIERHPAFGNHLVITRPNSSKMGSIRWLNDEYKANCVDSQKETNKSEIYEITEEQLIKDGNEIGSYYDDLREQMEL